MPPNKLLKHVKKPPTSPSDKGQANSEVYSKNNGARANPKLLPAMVEAYNCQVLKYFFIKLGLESRVAKQMILLEGYDLGANKY